jgi:hypothetical protein
MVARKRLSVTLYVHFLSGLQLILVPVQSGPGCSVGIATDYGLDGPGIESRWGGRDFPPVQTAPGDHSASCTMGTGSFPGGKVRPGRAADHSPLFSAEVLKE